jgi:hypothetical protein
MGGVKGDGEAAKAIPLCPNGQAGYGMTKKGGIPRQRTSLNTESYI